MSPRLRGRMRFAGLIAAVVLVCAIGVSVLDQAGGRGGGAGTAPGGGDPLTQPSLTQPQVLADPTIGISVEFPAGWSASGGQQRYPQLITLPYACKELQATCSRGVADIGNANGASTREAAVGVADMLNRQTAFGEPADRTTVRVDRDTTIAGHAAHVLAWHVVSTHPEAVPAFTQIVMVDTGQPDAGHPGQNLYSFLYVALDDSPAAPGVDLIDQLTASIRVHPVVSASPATSS